MIWTSTSNYNFAWNNYFENDVISYFECFSDFLEEYKNADDDYNFVISYNLIVEDFVDFNLECPTLILAVVNQRNGLYRTIQIKVDESDLPEIEKYLKVRKQYVLSIWGEVK